jgi:PIN domain nuclease of toxin-antitoxin system
VIVLDTHAWLWWVAEPKKLSDRARHAIEHSNAVGVCAVSCREVAMLVARKRLELDREALVWIRQALAMPRVTLLPLSPEVAVAAAGRDEGIPGDPTDRMIPATAIELGCSLVTKDRRLRSLSSPHCVW